MSFSADTLKRQGVADRLAKLIAVLAQSEVLPAGRVIAVDSPWGSGKTWLAERLPEYLKDDNNIGRCIYINAFQFDFHHDPFAVLASAILNGCAEYKESSKKLRTAAGAVLKASLPGLGKGLIKVGAKAIGVDLDVVTEALSEAAGKATEKAVDRLLSSFEETTSSTTAFKSRLAELASASGGPLVIVVDELDRCRPDFALDLLERVKHLFDVPGVVFLLFVHTPALHSAIEHTYGAGIDPAAYLKKFISVTLELPITDTPDEQRRYQTSFVSRFLETQYGASKGIDQKREFLRALAVFAPVFGATFRDLQNAVLLSDLFKDCANNFAYETAYLLLLRLRDPEGYVVICAGRREAYGNEERRLDPVNERDDAYIHQFKDMFSYHANPQAYALRLANQSGVRRVTPQGDCEEYMRFMIRVESMLKVQHLQL